MKCNFNPSRASPAEVVHWYWGTKSPIASLSFSTAAAATLPTRFTSAMWHHAWAGLLVIDLDQPLRRTSGVAIRQGVLP